MADYKTSIMIIRSSHFIFVVGQEQTLLTIHAAIVQTLSEPLYALMSNGIMKESTLNLATLDDVEADTFIAFCEYAYTGAYVTPDRASVDQDPKKDVSMDYNQRSTEPSAEMGDLGRSNITPSLRKKKYKAKSSYWDEDEPTNVINAIYPYERLWEEFRSRAFEASPALLSPDPEIIFHAKLYVFATRYLVEPLRQQCLKSLHRDLSQFSLNGGNISMILDVLEFTYAHTGRYEPGGKSPLRDLVIHFVACEARTLGGCERFTQILDSDAEMGSDLVSKLVK